MPNSAPDERISNPNESFQALKPLAKILPFGPASRKPVGQSPGISPGMVNEL
jgi:hypothetical protein